VVVQEITSLTTTPSAPLRLLRDFFFMAQPPLLARRGDLLTCFVSALMSLCSVTAAYATVPTPKVTGPIPSPVTPGHPSHNYPYFSTQHLVAKYNYIEEEFYVEGTAVEHVRDGVQTATIAPGGPYPYKTRVIVHRPKSSGKFNGTVILEHIHPLQNFESDWIWSHEHLMRRGFVHVGAAVMTAGFDSPTGLKAWNPARYGSLDVSAGGKLVNNQLAGAIFAQIAQAVKLSTGNLLPNLKVKNVIATGHSAAAVQLVSYYNSIQPLDGVVDGFVFHGSMATGLVRTDIKTPAWKLLSETDVIRAQAVSRQPDSEYFRTWEVAGASHGDEKLGMGLNPVRARDLGEQILKEPGFELPIGTRTPAYMVQDAVYDWMKKWIEQKVQPPHAPRIEISAFGKFGTPLEVRFSVAARDANGHAVGGIRLAQFAVATERNSGLNEGEGFCRFYGSHEPLDPAVVARLYPTQGKYIAEVNRITEANLKAGYITKEGAEQTRREARQWRPAGK
jgi:hypothetical protein